MRVNLAGAIPPLKKTTDTGGANSLRSRCLPVFPELPERLESRSGAQS